MDRRLLAAYVVCSLAVVFYVPYWVPQAASTSDSYVFGYNNRVGTVLALVLVAAGALWTRGWRVQPRAQDASPAVSRKTLLVVLALVLLGCLAMEMLAGRFGGYAESSYGIDRTWLLSQGKIPYVDFEWPFGAGLLYGPLLLGRWLRIGVAQGYYVFWILNCLAGIWLLYAVVNRVNYPTAAKKAIFLLLSGATGGLAVVLMAARYSPVRYAGPLYSILVVDRVLKGNGARARLYGALLSVGLTAALFLISPEIAISHGFACACLFALYSARRKGRWLAGFAELVLALGVVGWAALRLHVLDTLRASGSGADSFPIYFAPGILLYFAALFVCACAAVRRWRAGGAEDNSMGLIAFSIPMAAAALGRCDPAHLVLNGESVFLVSLFYVSRHRVAWKWYKAAFVVFLIALPAAGWAMGVLSVVERVSVDGMGGSGYEGRMSGRFIALRLKVDAMLDRRTHEAKLEAMVADAGNLAAADRRSDFAGRLYPSWQGKFLAPFGYRPNGYGSDLSGRVDYGRFEGFENANTVAAIGEKLGEIREHPEEALLLPEDFESLCEVDVGAERREMTSWFDAPYLGKAVHTVSLRRPVCAEIPGRYRMEVGPGEENYGYGLWVVRGAGSPKGG
ncbi:MAG: hypothetical protein WCC27_21090 [Acidobacteriaceae bacterium]